MSLKSFEHIAIRYKNVVFVTNFASTTTAALASSSSLALGIRNIITSSVCNASFGVLFVHGYDLRVKIEFMRERLGGNASTVRSYARSLDPRNCSEHAYVRAYTCGALARVTSTIKCILYAICTICIEFVDAKRAIIHYLVPFLCHWWCTKTNNFCVYLYINESYR